MGMGLTPIPIFNRKRGTQCYIIQKKTYSNWVQKSLHVKSTNNLMYGKKLLNLIKQNVKKFAAFLQGIADKHDYIKVILTGAGTSAYVGDTLVPYFKGSLWTNAKWNFNAIATTDIVAKVQKLI